MILWRRKTEEENRKELDEKSMIVEQARLEKEKKRKKNRRKKRIVLAVLLMLAAGGIWYFFWGRKQGAGRETTVKIEKAAGQEIVYARLDSVKGNEITYNTAEAGQQESGAAHGGNDVQSIQGNMPQEQGIQSGTSEKLSEPGVMPKAGSIQDGTSEDQNAAGVMPEAGSIQEGTSEDQNAAGIMPEVREAAGTDGVTAGRNSTGGAEASRGSGHQQDPEADSQMRGNMTFSGGATGGSGSSGFTYDGVIYGLTGETGTALIPVGTAVITRLGTETTFSRLQAGDYVALIMEGSGDDREIISVYILG